MDADEDRTTSETPADRALGKRGPGAVRGRAADDERATLEVASLKSPSRGRGAARASALDDDSSHAPIDTEDDEPTMEAGKHMLRREGTLDEPTIDRQDKVIPPRSPLAPGLPPRRAGTYSSSAAQAKIVIIAGNDNGREFPLTGKKVSIGRARENDIVLTDIAVSRKHLSLEWNGQRYKLVDHASGNGSLINDRLETGTCLLTHGDRLELGNTIFRFEHPATRNLAAADAEPPPDDDEFAEDKAPRTVVGKTKSSRKIAPVQPALPLAPPAQPALPLAPPAQPALAIAQPVMPLAQQNQMLPPRPSLPSPDKQSAIQNSPAFPLTGNNPLSALPQPASLAGPVLPPPSPAAPMEPMRPSEAGYGFESSGSHMAVPSSAEVLFSTSPVQRYAPVTQTQSASQSRGLIVGLLLATVGVVALAIAVFVVRSSSAGDQASEVAGVDSAQPSGNAADGAGAGDRDPASNTGARADKSGKEGKARKVPDTTWGTSETVLVASLGKTDAVKPENVDKTAGKAQGKEDPPKDPGETTRLKIEEPTTNQAQEQDTLPDDEEEGPGDSEGGSGDDDEPEDNRTSSTRIQPDKRSGDKQVKRPVTAPKVNTAAARKKALSEYGAKSFAEAAETLRAAASEAGGSEAEELRALAANYEKIGEAISDAESNDSNDAPAAFQSYKRALGLDKKFGGGEHSSFIRSKLSVVAPKAAAAYMAKGQFESAKSAADAAASYGAGQNPMVQRVREGLERKAEELYKSALRMKDNPGEADKLLKRILEIVPTDNAWYTKAYKRMTTR